MIKKSKKRYIRWVFLCLALLLLILMVNSIGVSRCFKADDTKNWYRKRIAFYLLPGILFVISSFFYKNKYYLQKNGTFLRIGFMCAAIVLATCAFQRITCEIPHRPYSFMDWNYALITLTITAAVFMLFWVVIPDMRIAAVCAYWFFWIAGYGYYCVGLFRGDPFHPMDIFSLTTAISVAGEFDFPLVTTQLFWLAWGGVLTVVASFIPPFSKGTKKVWIGKAMCIAAATGWIAVLLHTSFLEDQHIRTTAWHEDVPKVNRSQGTLTTLMCEVTQLLRQKPTDYDVQQILHEEPAFADIKAFHTQEVKPNVIVIMNEALADITQYWNLEITEDPLPYLHGLKKNTIHGNTYVPVYGGGTCNTEFGFLTGTPTVPQINIPMMTVIHQKIPSIAWQLKAQGYKTIAFHPYAPGNYRRDKAYPLLGFDEFISIDDVASAQTIRGYVSDQGCYDKIWELYQNKGQEERIFVFNVTMQNHCPYAEKDEVEQVIRLKYNAGATPEPWVEAYLNSIAYSDRSIENLIRRFEQEEEPTIILLFGDHQPQFILNHHGKRQNLTELKRKLTDYITPFVIWANYPIEEKYVEAISVHYLSAMLMEQTGLSLTPYDKWLLQAAKEFPVVHLHGYANDQGRFVSWNENEAWPKTITMQQFLRYNRINDHQNRLPGLNAWMPD